MKNHKLGKIKVCTDFKMLQVKVPIIFFGTLVFSARRDGRYTTTVYARLPETGAWTDLRLKVHNAGLIPAFLMEGRLRK
jgi:hypothetical protein